MLRRRRVAPQLRADLDRRVIWPYWATVKREYSGWLDEGDSTTIRLGRTCTDDDRTAWRSTGTATAKFYDYPDRHPSRYSGTVRGPCDV